METVLQRPGVLWNVITGQARTNERVAGIASPVQLANNPIPISAYYVGAIFCFAVVAKANVAISAIRIYGSLDPTRFPAVGDSTEALVSVTKDLALGQAVIRYPLGLSSAVGAEIMPRLLPPFLMLEYTCTGTSGIQLAIQVRAAFIGTPPYGEEPGSYAG
jgi:hypothetical protein